jgi:hypothetical protein
MLLKQSTARKVRVRLEQADGTNDTGKVFGSAGLEVWLGKEGAAEAQKTLGSGDFDEIGHGFYWLKLSTTDTNTLGTLSVTVVWGGVSTGYEHEVRTVLPDDLALASDWTSARAAKVDNLDAAVTTRAAAATALSTAQWTNARAALLDNLDAAVSTRLATSGYTAPDNADILLIKAKTDNLPASPAAVGSNMGTVTSVTGDVGGKVLGGGAGVISGTGVRAVDNSGNAIAPAATALSTAQWTNTRAALLDNLDAAVTTRAAAATALSTAQWTNARAALLDNLDATVSSRLAAIGYTAPDNADILLIKAKTDNLPANPAAQTLLDVAVSTRLATSGYTAPDNADILLIKAKTDNLPSDPADESLIIAATDAVMARIGAPAGASVSADIAAVGTSAASAASGASAAATAAGTAATAAGAAQTAAVAALAAATNALHAALGLYLVTEPQSWSGPDLVTLRCRLYDNKAHSVTNDGVTGLVVPEFVRTISYSGTVLSGDAHRPTKISGVEP